jgi:uncharacterized protein YecE (DUF72 family)
MTILVGTCSWTGRVNQLAQKRYGTPRPTPEQELRCYSSIFPTVEVDSTFYALPSLQNCQRWAERTPDDFVFHVKAFSLFTTHSTRTQSLPNDVRRALTPNLQARTHLNQWQVPPEARDELWRRYREALGPLINAGKLGFILLQFPPGFTPTGENADYILYCRDQLAGLNVAVEFRNRRWFEGRLRNRTPEFLKDNGLTMVCVDMPQGFDTSIPPLTEVTAQESYVRLHGRNTAAWEQGGVSVNNIHDYWYTRSELEEWLAGVRQLEEQTRRVYVMFNTVQGLETARVFQQMACPESEDLDELGSNRSSKLI